jgi:hypothetical protein
MANQCSCVEQIEMKLTGQLSSCSRWHLRATLQAYTVDSTNRGRYQYVEVPPLAACLPVAEAELM